MAAKKNADAEKSSYGLVIFGILYAIVTIIAICFSFEYEAESALKLHLICAGVASVILIFTFPKGKDYTVKREKASYIYAHLILWGGIIFFPFRDYPMISLGALLLLGISEAGYIASLNSDENKKRSDESKSGVAKFTGSAALYLLAIIVIISVLKSTGYDNKIIDWGKSAISGLNLSKRDSVGGVDDSVNQTIPPNSSRKMVKFVQWRSPIVIQISRSFTTSAQGRIDFNDNSNNAASLRINLPKSGDIVLLDGRVEEASNTKSKITGDWTQEKTGATGNYILTMQSGKVRLVLKNNGANVGIIELN